MYKLCIDYYKINEHVYEDDNTMEGIAGVIVIIMFDQIISNYIRFCKMQGVTSSAKLSTMHPV